MKRIISIIILITLTLNIFLSTVNVKASVVSPPVTVDGEVTLGWALSTLFSLFCADRGINHDMTKRDIENGMIKHFKQDDVMKDLYNYLLINRPHVFTRNMDSQNWKHVENLTTLMEAQMEGNDISIWEFTTARDLVKLDNYLLEGIEEWALQYFGHDYLEIAEGARANALGAAGRIAKIQTYNGLTANERNALLNSDVFNYPYIVVTTYEGNPAYKKTWQVWGLNNQPTKLGTWYDGNKLYANISGHGAENIRLVESWHPTTGACEAHVRKYIMGGSSLKRISLQLVIKDYINSEYTFDLSQTDIIYTNFPLEVTGAISGTWYQDGSTAKVMESNWYMRTTAHRENIPEEPNDDEEDRPAIIFDDYIAKELEGNEIGDFPDTDKIIKVIHNADGKASDNYKDITPNIEIKPDPNGDIEINDDPVTNFSLLGILKAFARWLFIPDTYEIEDFINNIKDNINNNYGLLTYPITLVIEFLMRVNDIQLSDFIINIPKIEIRGMTIFNGLSYNVSQAIRESATLTTLQGIIFNIGNFIIILGMLNFAKRKGDEIIRGI